MGLILHIFIIQLSFTMITVINSNLISDTPLRDNVNDKEKLFEVHELFNRTRRTVVTTKKEHLWNGAIIPYVIEDIFTGLQHRLIKQAMRIWEESTCITFVERIPNIHSKYITITKLNCGCCFLLKPSVRNGGFLSLINSCDKLPIVLHELGHVIGFEHEHNRPDRDDYLEIINENIMKGYEDEFKKQSPHEVETFNQTYDYHSVMHYPSDSFSISWPFETLIPKQGMQNEVQFMGAQIKLSEGDIATTNLLYNCPKCGETFYKPTGSFYFSMNSTRLLMKPTHCEWRIRAAQGERVELVITSLSIYETPKCAVDYLEIRNGYSYNNSVLARYCGDVNVATLTASNILSVAYVKMSQNISNSGFKAYYRTICGGTVNIKTNTPYKIESTNYPDAYPPNQRCSWHFTAPDNHRIALRVHFFELEMSDNCMNDFLMIKAGTEYSSPIIRLECGSQDSWQVNSTGPELSVIFSSDKLIEYAGFSATLYAIPLNN
ncbi:protein tolkin-like [Microplitis mediator]|uniref:protein tolkin-like n=1 Tax=Microplitis mediator TaxID=375433 RepID=UPI0025562C59|nr:protein tolkin-like [Microplitis mediator]